MILEFERWGLERRRKEIGGFQLACGIGILIGLKLNYILIVSSLVLITMIEQILGSPIMKLIVFIVQLVLLINLQMINQCNGEKY